MSKQNKIKLLLIVLACLLGFVTGIIIAEVTMDEPVEKEPTAYELLERIHGEIDGK